jgi:hypothetical protein
MHAVGFDVLLRAMMRSHTLDRSGFWSVTPTVIGLTLWLILIHMAEIAIWGQFYFWWGCMPDAETAFYFSAVMCGLSAGLFFALVLRGIGNWVQERTASDANAAR